MARTSPQPPAARARSVGMPPPDLSFVVEVRRGINKGDYRTVITLKEVVQLRLKIRRCPNPMCERFPESISSRTGESVGIAFTHEFGLDVIALVGAVRYQEHFLCVPNS